TYWESQNNAFPQWLQVDLGTAAQINQAVLKLPSATAWATRTQTLVIQGSTDGTSFSDIKSSAGYTFDPASGNAVTVNFTTASATVTRTGSVGTGTNLAAGKPIEASSTVYTFVATNANDNDVTTYWEGSAYPANLTVKLGANAATQSVVVKLNPDSIWAT